VRVRRAAGLELDADCEVLDAPAKAVSLYVLVKEEVKAVLECGCEFDGRIVPLEIWVDLL